MALEANVYSACLFRCLGGIVLHLWPFYSCNCCQTVKEAAGISFSVQNLMTFDVYVNTRRRNLMFFENVSKPMGLYSTANY